MKRSIYIILLFSLQTLIIPEFLHAQEAYYSQYYNSPTYYNPAQTGLNQGLNIRVGYRNQWPQFTNDLKTYNFSMDIAERFMPGAGGLGIIFNTNKEGEGLIKRTMMGALGSVRIKINKYWVSQVGFMAAYVQKKIDDEDFIWSDGEKQKRIWHLKKISPTKYEGRADDVVGVAKGEVSGNAFHWEYTLAVKVNDSVYKFSFDDWMYLMDDQVLINKAEMSKFGLTVGEINIVFIKRKLSLGLILH